MIFEDRNKPSRAVLVVATQPLVAQDIALTLGDEGFGAPIIVAASMQEGMKAIDAFVAIEIALVEAEEAAFSEAPLMAALSARGARICLIGSHGGLRWPTLSTPFTTEELVQAVKMITPPP